MRFRARIWRMVQQADDSHGGAVYSGTVAYECLQCHFAESRPNMLLLAQGIEVVPTARAYVVPPTVEVEERDELELTSPAGHPRLGERWRVVAVTRPPLHPRDSRGYVVLTLERVEMTRAEA